MFGALNFESVQNRGKGLNRVELDLNMTRVGQSRGEKLRAEGKKGKRATNIDDGTNDSLDLTDGSRCLSGIGTSYINVNKDRGSATAA